MIIGLFVTFDSVNLDSIAYLLTTVYLIVIGIQGFSDEADARWRRGVGGYGSILTAFLFANSLESDIYNAIGIVMTGMVALGFGFLFMQRMNEEDGIYEVGAPDGGVPTEDAGFQETPAMLDLEIVDEEEALDDMELKPALPNEEEEFEDLELELAELDEEENLETPAEPVAVAEKVEKNKPHSGLLDTGEGFALRLPREAVENILTSLESTPHEGYVPVVAFGPTGQIMLTFETEKSNA